MWTNYDNCHGDEMNNSKSTAATVDAANLEIWEHVTLKLLEFQVEAPQDFRSGDVFAVTCVEPLPEYGWMDGDGPEECADTAQCLLYIGYSPLHVLEIWSTWEGAAAACRTILRDSPESMDGALMVVPYQLQGRRTIGGDGQ